MLWQLDEIQVCAEGEIFAIGNGQENLVAYRLPFQIGSFTRLCRLHVSLCQNYPPLYWDGKPETPRRCGLRAHRSWQEPTPEIWRRETVYLLTQIYVCRVSNIEIWGSHPRS